MNMPTRCLFLLLLLTPCGAQVPNELEALRKTIEAHHTHYIESLKKGDADAFAELYHENALVLNPGLPIIEGRDSILRDRQQVFFRAKILAGVIRTSHLEQSGDLAYEVGRFSYTVKVGEDSPRIVEGKFLAVWKRGKDGAWRYQVDAGLPD